jgi:hypothetical protein
MSNQLIGALLVTAPLLLSQRVRPQAHHAVNMNHDESCVIHLMHGTRTTVAAPCLHPLEHKQT